MRIIWSNRAKDDLYLSIGYIAEQSLQNANNVLSKILTLCDSLTEYPYKYQKEELYNDANVRRVVIYSYKIVYKIYTDKIIILRVFNTKQQPSKI